MFILFWLGVVLVLIFSINLQWLPSSGAYDIGKSSDILNRIRHMILPLVVMILSHLWYYAYMIRNKLLDEIRKDYVLLAKSKGCNKGEIVFKHCFRNVAPTIVSIMAISIPHVLSGTYIAESSYHAQTSNSQFCIDNYVCCGIQHKLKHVNGVDSEFSRAGASCRCYFLGQHAFSSQQSALVKYLVGHHHPGLVFNHNFINNIKQEFKSGLKN